PASRGALRRTAADQRLCVSLPRFRAHGAAASRRRVVWLLDARRGWLSDGSRRMAQPQAVLGAPRGDPRRVAPRRLQPRRAPRLVGPSSARLHGGTAVRPRPSYLERGVRPPALRLVRLDSFPILLGRRER